MITSVTSSSSSASASMKKSIGMDKDDFLTLLITQLQNQDPLNPMDGTEFMTQMAQLTQVEQAYNTNTNLESILSALNNSSSLSASSLVGKSVSAAGSQVALTSGGSAQISYFVPSAAEQVTVTITDSNGSTVRTLTQGQTAAGTSSVTWDGRDASGNQLAAGTYNVSVAGINSAGNTVTCQPLVTGKVEGISYSGTSPTMTIGGLTVPFNNIMSVTGG
ncbi:MAG: flagellar hook assembly protein FlgD [Geobacteraceae bacterium]|nr:flagellar hook assembly protein FlgD [Geobacteraceae bacterium]